MKLEATAGFRGRYRVGEWLPLRVRVENDGEPINAEVTIETAQRRVAMKLALPAPSRKQVHLPLFVETRLRSLEVRLSSGGRTLETVTLALEPLDEDVALVAVAVDPAMGPAPSPEGGGSTLQVVRLPVEDLPDDWRGLAAVDELVLDVGATSALTPTQRRALETWTLLGGRLRAVGRGARVSLSGIVGSKPPSSFARNRPLLHRIDRRLLAGRPIDAGRSEPPTAWLAGFLGLYLLVFSAAAGAAHRAASAARKLPAARRLGLVVPAVAVAFTALATSVGAMALGREGRLLETSIVHVFPARGDAFASSRSVFEAAGRGRHRLIAPDGSVHFDPSPGPGQTEVTLAEEAAPSLAFRGASFSRRAFYSHRELATDILPGRLASAPPVVRNPFHSSLTHCVLASGDRLERLRDLPPEATLELSAEQRAPISRVAPTGDGDTPELLERVLRRYRRDDLAEPAQTLVVCHASEFRSGTTAPTGAPAGRGEAVVLMHFEEWTEDAG